MNKATKSPPHNCAAQLCQLMLRFGVGCYLKTHLHRRFLSRQLNAIFVAPKLQLQNRRCKPGAIFSATYCRNIAGVSNMFEIWCNFLQEVKKVEPIRVPVSLNVSWVNLNNTEVGLNGAQASLFSAKVGLNLWGAHHRALKVWASTGVGSSVA